MSEARLHGWLVMLVVVSVALTAGLLLKLTAPYGRFARPGWGPTLPARLAWMLFESPAVLVFTAIYALGDRARDVVPLVLLLTWLAHYLPRTFVYPLLMRDSGRRVPVAVAALAIVFNVLNAYVNARWISHLGEYPARWLVSVPFLSGTALFAAGWIINRRADRTLRGLRAPGESGYRIPQGGLFRYVSCPNYFGEIVMWCGWAIATWSAGVRPVHGRDPRAARHRDASLVPQALRRLSARAARRLPRDTLKKERPGKAGPSQIRGRVGSSALSRFGSLLRPPALRPASSVRSRPRSLVSGYLRRNAAAAFRVPPLRPSGSGVPLSLRAFPEGSAFRVHRPRHSSRLGPLSAGRLSTSELVGA